MAVTRKRFLEVLLQACERRVELVEIAHAAVDREAALAAVTDLLDLEDDVYACAVLDLQLSSFTAEHRRRLAEQIAQEERDPTEARMGAESVVEIEAQVAAYEAERARDR